MRDKIRKMWERVKLAAAFVGGFILAWLAAMAGQKSSSGEGGGTHQDEGRLGGGRVRPRRGGF